MAIEEITIEALQSMEEQAVRTANRLRDIRVGLKSQGKNGFSANVGTLRHSIERAEIYSGRVHFRFEESQRA